MDLFETFAAVKEASRKLSCVNDDFIGKIINETAGALVDNADKILAANSLDLNRMDPSNPKYDRLKLTGNRIMNIASDARNVALLPSPLGRVIDEYSRPNGLLLKKVSVPFGVIGVIYEARPNVTVDVFVLCLKAGSACLLKGGSDAYNTNMAILEVIHDVLRSFDMDSNIVQLLPPDHESAVQLMHANDFVDVIIPRGSSNLISFVRNESTVLVIETGAGICHTYFDIDGDKEIGAAIVNNAKTRRVSVCNALDCLLIHSKRLTDLPYICAPLIDNKVIIYADEPSYEALKGVYPDNLLYAALPESYGTEFLDYKMSVKTVNNLNEALSHIEKYSSKHSECIITENKDTAALFQKQVDAACVYVNVSTAFTDGGMFGLGAEIGISTQKLHARGPMGLCEITTYKWLIEGNGQIRTS